MIIHNHEEYYYIIEPTYIEDEKTSTIILNANHKYHRNNQSDKCTNDILVIEDKNKDQLKINKYRSKSRKII